MVDGSRLQNVSTFKDPTVQQVWYGKRDSPYSPKPFQAEHFRPVIVFSIMSIGETGPSAAYFCCGLGNLLIWRKSILELLIGDENKT